jgi:nitrite reductase/ring-hydroxylating ferredoxin subunit
MTTTRRVFLQVLGAGAGALTVGGLPMGCGPAAGPVSAGNASALALDTVAKVAGTEVLVGLDAGGLYAMSSICTHFGCNLNEESGSIESDGSIACGSPCGHGSVFGRDGSVLGGPAGAPLKHWRVDIDDAGEITVQVGDEVGIDDRTPLPTADV